MLKVRNGGLQMCVLPSVQPFHAIAYPIDPLLALDIRSVLDISPFFPPVFHLFTESVKLFAFLYLFSESVAMSRNYSFGLDCVSDRTVFCGTDSRKYADHCYLIASRLQMQPFVHPPAVPVKSKAGSGRLRVGYVNA